MKEFPKAYEPQKTEDRIYKLWEKSGFFNPDNLPKTHKEPFTIALPPPNVTGTLHMGHAVMLALQDIMIRYNRMKGKKTLWLPGTDHAAIATQSRVEKDLYKAKKQTRHDLKRKKFLQLVDEFAKESHDTIVTQMKKMGSSVDWSREAFTLDKERNLAVRTAFKKMYKDGLIYRGNRIVNWDPKMQTTVSDDEIEWKEEKANFYYLKYGPFTIGTARPETKFGDKYVVMHPKDKRYTQYKQGQEIEVDWINGTITATIIKDEAVDMQFGTGVMTITPWHDATDFEIAERHNLDKEQIIDEKGKLLPIAQEFSELHISKARPAIVEKLKTKGLLKKVDESYTHRLATNSRGGGLIEPQILLQWFVDVSKKIPGRNASLKELMYDAVKQGKIEIMPEQFQKIYFHWINHLRDWCISRQLWYGHRIPVWYRPKADQSRAGKKLGFHKSVVPQVFAGKTKTYRIRDRKFKLGDRVYFENSQNGNIFGQGKITNIKKTSIDKIDLKDPNHGATYNSVEELVGAIKKHYPDNDVTSASEIFIYTYVFDALEKKEIYVGVEPPKGKGWIQDPDTLDTWFSSGLWTFSTLGWPKKTKDLKTYHPTSVVETGYDILFFWVARMILMTGYLLKDIPFQTVYLHGLVRDAQGRKMSKSLGNIIDPLLMTEKYGADATRLSLIIGATAGRDVKLSEDKVRGYRNFANKLWNISRFIIMNTQDYKVKKKPILSAKDKKILKDFERIAKKVTQHIEAFRFSLAAETLYHYIWHTFADKVLEQSKSVLQDKKARQARQYVLLTVLENSLKLLHPFTPFVTEEIYQRLHKRTAKQTLMIEKWPI